MKIERARERKKRKKRNRYIYRLSVLIILIAAIVFALYMSNKPESSTYRIGDSAPDFKLDQLNESVSNTSQQLSELNGKGVMVNFWDTSCRPCETEMPFLEEVYETYKDKDIEFIAVSVDVSDFVVKKYIHSFDVSFPVVRDNKDQVKNLFNISKLPSKIFIDEHGQIVDIVENALEPRELSSYLDQIVPN